jgi:hypothetical protein
LPDQLLLLGRGLADQAHFGLHQALGAEVLDAVLLQLGRGLDRVQFGLGRPRELFDLVQHVRHASAFSG